MQTHNTNSFDQLVDDDIEHIIFGTINFGTKGYQSNKDHNRHVFNDIKQVQEHKFLKKYSLIYQNDNSDHACDFNQPSRYETQLLCKIISENTSTFFMIIDHGRFNHFALRQLANCQVWPRKYFAPFHCATHSGSRDQSVILQKRKHWFCSILGANNSLRSLVFDWIVKENLHLSNKISYLCFGTDGDRAINNSNTNYQSQDITSKHIDMIPYNNFEDNIPNDNLGRLKNTMPLYDCLFNVVVESFQTNNNAFHSEKTLNTILYGHIPVILGGEGSMKKLVDMGIIIPDYIQWSIWDDIPVVEEHSKKREIIQRQLLNFFSNNNIEEISQDWYPYALRNLKKFANIPAEAVMEEKEICRWILTMSGKLGYSNFQTLYK